MTGIDKAELLELIEACKKGKRQAQQVVYEALYPKMKGVCLRYFPDQERAHDVLQEGFIKMFLNLEKYNGEGSFEGWVRRIISNTAIDTLRKNKNVHFTSIDDTNYSWLEQGDNSEIEWNETLMREKDRVLEAVHALSPGYRAVFVLYVIEDYTHKEIADELGISEGTSKSNLAKAKMNLKKTLGELQY